MEFVKPTFQSLFEDTTVTTNFLKNHVCSTFCIEIHILLYYYINSYIHILFAIFNNQELRNFKDQLTEYLKEWMMDNGKSFHV